MKTTFKWLAALFVMIMGAFVFTSCGDDDDPIPVPPTLAQLIGTWTVTSSTNEGPREGTVLTFNENGTVTTSDGSGEFAYDPETGHFEINIDGLGEIIGTITINGSVATVNYTMDGESSSFKMKKGTSGGGSYPAKSDLYGTWLMTSATESGTPVGALFTIKSDGSIAMKGNGTAFPDAEGTYTYSSTNGQMHIEFPDMIEMTGTASLSGDNLTLSYTNHGSAQTIVLQKYNGGGGGGEGGDETDWDEIDGWKATYSENTSIIPLNTPIKLNEENGTALLNGDNYTFTKQNDSEDECLRYTFFDENNQEVARLKCNYVQNGNVLNGQIKVYTGSSWTDRYGVTFTKDDYTVPSSGIKGRWRMTDHNMGEQGPDVGGILVFGDAGELYVEGDYKIGSYSYNSSTQELYISMIDATGTLETTGWTTGSTATFTLGGIYVTLQKL